MITITPEEFATKVREPILGFSAGSGGGKLFMFDDPALHLQQVGLEVLEIGCVKIQDNDYGFGQPESPIFYVITNRGTILCVLRHGIGHKISPHFVNYQANIGTLKRLGCRNTVHISAVGTLSEDHPPGKLVLGQNIVDWTGRPLSATLISREMSFPGHLSAPQTTCQEQDSLVMSAAGFAGVEIKRGLSAVGQPDHHGFAAVITGNRFNNKFESFLWRHLGAYFMSMTAQEVFLAREFNMHGSSIWMPTDWDSFKEGEEVSVEAVVKRVSTMMGDLNKLCCYLIRDFFHRGPLHDLCKCRQSFTPASVQTDSNSFSIHQRNLSRLMVA